uniref:MULE transposase domain-containing protein n=1 Tax=Schizaphis graminum TaxID=13262 RepID=A0A2S2NHY4_SCHGA
MLKKISELCDNMGHLFLPTNLISDFEKAILNAIYEVWPGMNVVGCRFHLTQSWYRQIQFLGIITEYKNKCNIGMWLRHSFGLLFLNPSEVMSYFMEDFMPQQCPFNNHVLAYSQYLLNNYILNTSTFPPKLWAEATSALTRTTNVCESFHSDFDQ